MNTAPPAPGISTRLRTICTGISRFDIACELTEDTGALEAVWLYRRSVSSDDEIGNLEQLMKAVLEEAGRNPDFIPEQHLPI